jgi:predicted outer membrane repeat protein
LSNYHVNITLSTFSYNIASYVGGGGVFMYENNHHIDLVQTTFSHNFGYSGGGVYLYSSNTAINVVGSKFSGNTAEENGGAIYYGDNCDDFMIIDVEGYDKLKTYQTSSVVHSDTIVFLDQDYDCPVSYDLNATDVNQHGVLGNNFNPGITTAPLILSNGSISITYEWDLTDYIYQYCRRPKLISVPIVNNPVHKSLFVKNSAYHSGGAIYLSANNMFIKVINAEFRENEALLNGGAIGMVYGNQGAIFANLNLISNTAKERGGAVYSFTNNLGAKFYKSTFHSNRAGTDGGAISFQHHDGNIQLIINLISIFTLLTFMNCLGRKYFRDDSNNTIIYCVFYNNSASSFAGAVHVNDGNSIIIKNTHMKYNNAADGGAIQMGSITSKVKSGT